MLRQLGEVVELGPGENALAVWLGCWQFARVGTDGHDDGLRFHLDGLAAIRRFKNHVVVAVEATKTVEHSNARRGEHVVHLF